MDSLDHIRYTIRREQAVLSDRYGVSVSGVFGSYARGEQKPDSDLDVLVEIVRPISLIELVGAEQYLSDVLGRKVDMVPRRSLRSELRDGILEELVAV